MGRNLAAGSPPLLGTCSLGSVVEIGFGRAFGSPHLIFPGGHVSFKYSPDPVGIGCWRSERRVI